MQDSSNPPAKKRYFDAAFKARVVEQSHEPHSSAVAVAKQHDLRVALIYKWRRQMKRDASSPSAVASNAFVQLPSAAFKVAEPSTLRIECHHAGKHLVLDAPIAVLDTCLTWLST